MRPIAGFPNTWPSMENDEYTIDFIEVLKPEN